MPERAAFWRAVDWSAPWLTPYAQIAHGVVARLEQGASVAQALGGDGLQFVPQQELPDGEPYESFVRRSGTIPTRDNLHDLFNGLVWRCFPVLKRRLNGLHAAQIATEGVGAMRGPLRDALTLFDENGALLRAPPALVEALRARDWPRLFVVQRERWRDVRVTLVGHALLEKLVQPRKPITAHVWLHEAPLKPDTLATKAFLTLPVLGVPGWWPANEDPAFYADIDVFRPPRR